MPCRLTHYSWSTSNRPRPASLILIWRLIGLGVDSGQAREIYLPSVLASLTHPFPALVEGGQGEAVRALRERVASAEDLSPLPRLWARYIVVGLEESSA